MIFFGQYYTVKVRAQGYINDNGEWVEGTETPTTVFANAQTMSAYEAKNYQIGKAGLQKIWIFSDYVFNVASEDTKQNGDLFPFDGKYYEIIYKDVCQNNLINHYEYIGELRS